MTATPPTGVDCALRGMMWTGWGPPINMRPRFYVYL